MKFEDYKNEHYGQEAVIMGTGPSINRLGKAALDFLWDKVVIGCNEMVFFERPVDYYFIGDAQTKLRGYNSNPEAYNAFQPKLQKFYRDPLYATSYCKIPRGLTDGIYYPCNFVPDDLFPSSIEEIPPLRDCYSVSFEMIQFALYAGFKTIYLVGQDCDYSDGTFNSDKVLDSVHEHINKVLYSWSLFEEWRVFNCPDVRFLNINPVKMRRFDKFIL